MSSQMQTIIRILITIALMLYTYYISNWFTLKYQINGTYDLNLQYFCYILIVLIIIIEFLYYKKNKHIVFFHFLFWFLALLLATGFYLGSIQAFFVDINDMQDHIIRNKLFYIKIDLNYNYKLELFCDYIDIYLTKQNLTVEKQAFISRLIIGSLNDNVLKLSFVDLKYSLPNLVEIAKVISESPELLSFGEKMLLYSSPFYKIIRCLQVLIMVLALFKFAYLDLPYFILIKFFAYKPFMIVLTVLVNTPDANVLMYSIWHRLIFLF